MNTRYFIILWIACIISTFAVIPFTQTVTLFVGAQPTEFTPAILAAMAVETILLYGLALFFGLRFAQKIGIRFLFLDKNTNYINDLIKPGLFAGIGCALAILIVDQLLPSSSQGMSAYALAKFTPPLYGLLASIFGVINQEVLLCLLGISGIALLLKKLFKNLSMSTIMGISIFFTSLLFGLAHIPTFIHAISFLGSSIIIRMIILNLISGITFGLLFWKKGFETAVFTHFIVDFIIYFVVPLLSQ